MTNTKVAVVGVGALGEHHARIYSEAPEADLVGVVDVVKERAEKIAVRYGSPAYQDYREIIGQVEAVSLAVPTRHHAQIGVDLLKNGIHVLVEKPIADTLDEAEALIETASEQKAVLHVGHSERFNPALLAVLPYVRQPQFFEAHRLGVFVPRSLDVDVILDLMIHDLDLIRHLVEGEIREIRAVGIPVLTPRVDIANARLEFENGCVANVTASRVSTERIRKLRFFQPSDYVSIDFHNREVEMYSLVAGSSGRQIAQRQFEIDRGEPLQLEIQTFLRAVRGEALRAGTPPGCPGAEAKQSLALALDIKEEIERRGY